MVHQSNRSLEMADGTRFKDIQEAQKRLDQVLQTESMKREASEVKLQEQISTVSLEVKKQLGDFAGKFDHISTTLASFQLQLQNIDHTRSTSGRNSVLGHRPQGFFLERDLKKHQKTTIIQKDQV